VDDTTRQGVAGPITEEPGVPTRPDIPSKFLTAYLAARYSRRLELVGYKASLAEAGIHVTSRWLDGSHQASERDLLGEGYRGPTSRPHLDFSEVVRFGTEDVEDIGHAYFFIAFTEEPRQTNSRGGRHVELGLALGTGKQVIVVGPRENVFCALQQVMHFDAWREAFEFVSRWAKMSREQGAPTDALMLYQEREAKV
jgi:hypothetical protein